MIIIGILFANPAVTLSNLFSHTFSCIFSHSVEVYRSVFVFDSFNSCTLALMLLPRSVKSQNTHRRSNKITQKITETKKHKVTC